MKGRLFFFVAVVFLWSGAIAARLWQLQVRDHEAYRSRAARQQQRVVEVDPPRGTIYDSRGREMAVSVQVDSAYAVPREVGDPEVAARRLAAVLKTDPLRLADSLRSDREFVWVARKLDRPIAEKVRGLELPGIYFLPESKRYYPMRELAAPILGYVGTDDYGLAGLELEYNEVVSGHAERRIVMRDAGGGSVIHPDLAFGEAEPGEDLRLTIDASVQHIVERELDSALERYRAKAGTVVVLDPTTGAVLAMASRPAFDPNHFTRFDRELWRNRALVDAYEPGSTFKMVTAAAVLGANALDPSDILDCGMGEIRVGSIRIRDHKPFGELSFRDVLAKSSNVGTIKAALKVGPEALHRQIGLFGFGRPTGIDLPGESHGIVHPLRSWSTASCAYVSFGQEVSVTPLQLASAFAAVANGGELLRPYVVESIGRGSERRLLHPRPELRSRAISDETARNLERMLEGVVEDGTGRKAAIRGYRVAGKTGTAQKAIPGRGYSQSRFVASFVGFAPARRAELVALVVLDEPRTSIHGGSVAAPTFQAIAERILLYRGVRPDRELLAPAGKEAGAGDEEGDILPLPGAGSEGNGTVVAAMRGVS